MKRIPPRISAPFAVAVGIVGLVVGPLLLGFEPIGSDPDLLYRPIKSELGRFLRQGRLPLWSDRFGLGVPLLAESHVAALYPPNWVLYGVLDVSTAYRLAMWLHYIGMAAATYAYARVLGISSWGASLAGVSFTLCGFQAVHAGHEPFYHTLALMPLALLAADRYAATGRAVWMAGLSLALGAQWTLGHFQVQFWTCGLVLMTGLWRIAADRRPPRRAVGLAVALVWGGLIAAAQIGPTAEMTRVSGLERSFAQLVIYGFPPSHLAQPALPEMFLDLIGGTDGPYWGSQGTNGGEACFYLGTVPLILACVGLVGDGRGRELAPWRVIVAASLVLATLPRWWPEGYWLITRLPGFGHFRCPARYTALASLGISLLAGRGLDRAIAPKRFWVGMTLALVCLAGSSAWTAHIWAERADYRDAIGAAMLTWRLGGAALVWLISLAAIVFWRRGRVGGGMPLLVAAIELTTLYYLSHNRWGRSAPLPSVSPILSWLAREPDVDLVAGRIFDLPVRAGQTSAYPYLGIPAPSPNYLMENASTTAAGISSPSQAVWLRRFGVTHSVWVQADGVTAGDVVFHAEDPELDRILDTQPQTPSRRYEIRRHRGANPRAWVASQARVVSDWPVLYGELSRSEDRDIAWFLAENAPPDGPFARARSARLRSWDGREAVVEADGTCDLLIRRTHYPGWTAWVDDGPEQQVVRADAGIQSVRLLGAGVHRVVVRYEPSHWQVVLGLSISATLAALLVLGVSWWRELRHVSA